MLLAHIEGHFSGDKLVHIQQVIDQLAKTLTITLSDTQHVLHHNRHLTQSATVYQAKGACNSRQWRAQLMADGGNKLIFHLFDALALADVTNHGNKTKLALIGNLRHSQFHNKLFAALALG